MSPLLASNLATLRQRWPELARRVETAREQRVALRSPEEAQRLAARWVHGRRINAGALLAVTGFGDGVHVRQLLDVLPERAHVFVGEAEPGRLRAVLASRDLAPVLAHPRLTLAAGPCDDGFFANLGEMPLLHAQDVAPWIFAPEYNRAAEYYARFLTEFARQVDFRRKLEGTRVVDAELWQANTFANLPRLTGAPDVAVLRAAFAGLPLVIVSAGPSLDESLDFLRAASRVAVVVTVNSSYRAVRHAGIVPPIVLAADPREFTARGFAGVPVDGTYLITTPIVNPEVVRLFAGRTFTWSGSNELVQILRRRAGLPPGTSIVEQGTVSACAVDLAVLFGCDRICLVGQDLAIRPDGRSHAQDSFYSDLGWNRADLMECRRLPGNTLPEVLVESKLYVYLKTFEQLVVHRPGLKWCNTSRLGARIAGVPYLGFDDALRWLGTGSASRVPGILASRLAAGDRGTLDAKRLRSALATTETFAQDVLRLALRAASRFETLPDRLLAEGQENDPAVQEALHAGDELEALIARCPEEVRILEEGRARKELFRARRAEAQLAGVQGHARRVLLARERVWAWAEGAWFLLNCLRRLDADLAANSSPTA